MNTPSYIRPIRKGFTLMELTVVLVIGLMIAGVTTSLFTQQMSMFTILKGQNFMLRDAPKINGLLNNIITRADAIKMYANTADAKAGANSATTGATVIALKFQGSSIIAGGATLSESYAVIAFDSATGTLNYYGNLASLAALPATPDWQLYQWQLSEWQLPDWRLADQVQPIEFSITNGVLRIQLTGPHGGEMTYSTTPL